MRGFGRTLRRAGDLRLLALPVEVGRERYCVVDAGVPLATFSDEVPALAFFRALRAAGTEPARPSSAGPGRLVDLAAYRRRRARCAAGGPPEDVGKAGEA